MVELSRKFKDMKYPFGMIDQFLLTIGFEDECETLTLLGVWPFWPYRTTLIRKHQKGRAWTVVELSRKFNYMKYPFGMIDQFLLTIGFEDECETLTPLGVEPQSLWILDWW